MNKTIAVNQNSIEPAQKDTLHGKKKSGPSRDSQPDTQSEETDSRQGHYSKATSHFDYSNLNLFFGARPTQINNSTQGFIGKVHSKKKSNETTSSKEGNLKHTSSKDFSNMDELYENTTIINNPTETKPHFKKRSNEIAVSKNMSDENNEAMTFETSFFKNHLKKKSREKSFSTLLKNANKEEKAEQEIASDISKLGFNMDDDQEKTDFAFNDIKASKNNLKVLERIKNKALHNRNGSNNAANVSETPKSVQPSQVESRNNNNSVFTGLNVSKLSKAISPIIMQYKDKEIYNDDTNDQAKFINELFENPKKTDTSEKMPLDKSKEISKADLNPKLLTETTTSKTTKKTAAATLSSNKDTRKKPDLSLISTDSTVDSENFALIHDHHNNSFSTPFSGASGSFNNSGKLDFSSPAKIDSGRMNSESSENYLKNYSMQKNMTMLSSRMSLMPCQRLPPVNLNQSCMSFCGGYGSGNTSDRSSTNLSFNEEYLNNFNTPQARPSQNFLNQSFNMPSNNVMEQFFIAPQAIQENQFRTSMDNSFTLMDQQDKSYTSGSKTGNQTPGDPKNTSRSRRKTHETEDGTVYEIDLNKIEASARTTLMVRNIPNKYDLTLILQTIDKNHKGKFDFFYLPIDFSNRCNFGYAFINFLDPKHIKDFYNEFHGKRWEKFNSEKICEIKYARIQGHQALMQHFQYSRVMNQQDKKLRPYIPSSGKYGLPNKQKIEELIRQQKLESVRNDKTADSKRQYK